MNYNKGQLEKGEYMPSLLFSDNQILENIAEHPMVIWKMQ